MQSETVVCEEVPDSSYGETETIVVEDAEPKEKILTMVVLEPKSDCSSCIAVPVINGYQEKGIEKEESDDSSSMMRINVQIINASEASK